jgi:hypothetical protein
MQVQAYLYKDTGSALKSIWAVSGMAGFYRGLAPTLLRDVPEVAIQFTVYEALRKVRKCVDPVSKSPPTTLDWEARTVVVATSVCSAGATRRGKTADIRAFGAGRRGRRGGRWLHHASGLVRAFPFLGESSCIASLCSLGAETVLCPRCRSIKTRVQCGASSPSALLQEVVRQKGVQGLFVGVGPRVAQVRCPRRHVLRCSRARISI